MIEVEVKCAVAPQARHLLEARLREARFERHTHNVDVYYDMPDWDLLQKAVFLRVRNQQKLEFKFNEQAEKAHIQSTERAFSLQPQPDQAAAMNELFSHFLPTWTSMPTWEAARLENKLVELARIENTRRQYSLDSVRLCVDHVTGLGDFLEAEIECAEGTDTRQARAQLYTFIAEFTTEPLPIGYVELWLRQHNPQAYCKGIYQLPGDAVLSKQDS